MRAKSAMHIIFAAAHDNYDGNFDHNDDKNYPKTYKYQCLNYQLLLHGKKSLLMRSKSAMHIIFAAVPSSS